MATNIKSKKFKKDPADNGETKKYNLDPFEYNFLLAMSKNRNNTYNQYQGAISAFLSYLAGTKWGYSSNDLLKFEFDEDKQEVKVSVVDEETKE